MKRLGQAPKVQKDPTPAEIEGIAMTLRRKVEDMERVGDVAATFAPVSLGPAEIRTVSWVLEKYLHPEEEGAG